MSRHFLVDHIVIEGTVGEGWNITVIIAALAGPNDVWDVKEEELQKMKKVWTAIGNDHGFKIVSVDGWMSDTLMTTRVPRIKRVSAVNKAGKGAPSNTVMTVL
jgi:hypothetical protein